MSTERPTVVLVHGAFAESASWNGVIERLHAHPVEVIAAANPLRSLSGDAAYLRDVLAGVGGPVVLVGHSYGGMVVTEAASGNDAVVALVYVGAFCPESGESALTLSTMFPGSTLAETLVGHPLSDGGTDLRIAQTPSHRSSPSTSRSGRPSSWPPRSVPSPTVPSERNCPPRCRRGASDRPGSCTGTPT